MKKIISLSMLFIFAMSFTASAETDKDKNETYTFVRCWYSTSSVKGLPKIDYIWALNPSTGKYFQLRGYWWQNDFLQWKNMFYTDFDRKKLVDICKWTVDKKLDGKAKLVQINAADTDQSFNYDIWFNDTQENHPKRLITFGDSLSDTGNLFNSSSWEVPNQSSWYLGHLSNGPLWNEYLANEYGLLLNNWAVAMAGTEQQYGVLPGIVPQVESFRQYIEKADNFDPSSCLAVIMIGGNDFLSYNTDVDVMAVQVGEAVEKLHGLGVKNILVMNMMDITIAPKFNFDKSLKKTEILDKINKYNSRLETKIAALQARYQADNIKLINMEKLVQGVLSDSSNGITNKSESCLKMSESIDFMDEVPLRATCKDPDTFAFWDIVHPTTRMHAIIAVKLAEHIKKEFPDIAKMFLASRPDTVLQAR